jgi:hypothetical protein
MAATWGRGQGTPLAARLPTLPANRKGPIVIDDQQSEDIRSLFDWRNAPQDSGETTASPVANDDLALALSLLSCNSRDREQFRGGRASA